MLASVLDLKWPEWPEPGNWLAGLMISRLPPVPIGMLAEAFEPDLDSKRPLPLPLPVWRELGCLAELEEPELLLPPPKNLDGPGPPARAAVGSQLPLLLDSCRELLERLLSSLSDRLFPMPLARPAISEDPLIDGRRPDLCDDALLELRSLSDIANTPRSLSEPLEIEARLPEPDGLLLEPEMGGYLLLELELELWWSLLDIAAKEIGY